MAKRPSELTPLISFRVSPDLHKILDEYGLREVDVVGKPLGASRGARQILIQALDQMKKSKNKPLDDSK